MPGKKAIISVINDLVTDQRVAKSAQVLMDMGYDVLMVGRQKSDSLRMPERMYPVNRMRLLWEKGPVFYAEYNLRLFFFLLFQKCDLLFSNDLDTLLPNYLIHKIKGTPIIYDSHEYFTETPELTDRPFVRNTWKRIEKLIVPGLKFCITVNSSIAELFRKEYAVDFSVVRNIPGRKIMDSVPSRKELGLPENQKIIVLQGAGINIQRGAEELVEAMKYLDDVLLLIIGGGDVLPVLKDLAAEFNVDQKIMFIPKQLPDRLFFYTSAADLGLTLDKDTNINYRFSLPNKLFDYIHAGIPVLASPLPEIKAIIGKYEIGGFIESHQPEHIAARIRQVLDDESTYSRWKNNLKLAAAELNWENERKVLCRIIEHAGTSRQANKRSN